jgi:hypothetical protein
MRNDNKVKVQVDFSEMRKQAQEASDAFLLKLRSMKADIVFIDVISVDGVKIVKMKFGKSFDELMTLLKVQK